MLYYTLFRIIYAISYYLELFNLYRIILFLFLYFKCIKNLISTFLSSNFEKINNITHVKI